ncbi:hypothetical protein DKX38_010869 [Salix brachista]|uniref:MYB transcription factor n=1 Tax=Salix brachista TaxID=2182728 RepID=A0A5N5LZU1_9ROSI|nr:hypothetical protein DKX38_010869 [Salix brachista]
MPETMPISPGLYSTNASEEAENGLLHNGPMLLARRAKPFFQIFGRELDIFNRIRELCYLFQKWTVEDEAALKAGVLKHGTGKWRTILTDPDFSAVLRLRSNVDLKEKGEDAF